MVQMENGCNWRMSEAFNLTLRSPSEVASVQAQSTVLGISSTNADGVHAIGAKLRVSSRSSKFKLSLLTDDGHVPSSLPPLVPFVLGDTWSISNGFTSVHGDGRVDRQKATGMYCQHNKAHKIQAFVNLKIYRSSLSDAQ